MPDVPRPRTPTIVLGVVVAAVVAVAAYSSWGWQSAAAAVQVHIVAGPGPIRCNDGVLPVRLADEDDQPTVVIQMDAKPGAWCRVPISVRNDSSRTITVKDLAFPVSREDSAAAGALIVTDRGQGYGPAGGPVGSKESLEARFKIDEQVEPGDFSTYVMTVKINPRACVDAGVWGLPDVPRVRFSVLHRGHETNGAIWLQAKIGKEGLTWSGCA